MKVLFVFSLLLFGTVGYNSPSFASNAKEPTISELIRSNSVIEQVQKEEYSASLPTTPVDNKRYFSKKCTSIITKEGRPGPVGRKLIKAMKRMEKDKEKACFFGDSSQASNIGKYCKGAKHFDSLSQDQKESLWLWFWASLAQIESGCDPNVQFADARIVRSANKRISARNIEGGLFSLPLKLRNFYPHDKVYCPKDADKLSAEYQSNCSVSRFADIHCGTDPFRRVKGKHGFKQWKPLVPSYRISKTLKALIKTHPLCQ